MKHSDCFKGYCHFDLGRWRFSPGYFVSSAWAIGLLVATVILAFVVLTLLLGSFAPKNSPPPMAGVATSLQPIERPTRGREYLNGVYADPPDTVTPKLLGLPWDYTINNSYQDNCTGCGVFGLTSLDGYPVIIDIYHVQSSYPDFEAAARGGYSEQYLQTANKLVPYASQIYAVRIDSEFNGSWSAASAFAGKRAVTPSVWISGFRNLAKAIHTALPRAKIIWNPNIGQHDPFPYYPGDDVIDLVGPDLYCQPAYFSTSVACWDDFLHGPRSSTLVAFEAFSRDHRKPLVIPEWGDLFGDGYMIQRMRDWMDRNKVVAQSYWDSGEALASTAYLPALTKNQKAFVEAFGNRPYIGTYWNPLIPVPTNADSR